jgi:hypothetical protein
VIVEVAGIACHDRENAGEEQNREDDEDLHAVSVAMCSD